MTKKIRTKKGDIFQIPLDNEQFCFGQVLENKSGVLRITTFKTAYNQTDKPDPDEVLIQPIFLLTDTLDAKIYHGDWKVYANRTPIGNLPKPNFKYGLDTVYITDYDNSKKRVATHREADNLDFQFSVSPIRIQNAMQAFFGTKPWDKDFDKLTLDYCKEKESIKI
jgi:hypothetical protein